MRLDPLKESLTNKTLKKNQISKTKQSHRANRSRWIIIIRQRHSEFQMIIFYIYGFSFEEEEEQLCSEIYNI